MQSILRIVSDVSKYEWPKVAVVTRTHRRLQFLPRCFNTLDRQEFKEFVHVIYCDGGGVSEVESLISGYTAAIPVDRDVILLGAEGAPLGRAAAANAAMAVVRSEYAIFLDDDDTWHPALLDLLLAAVSSPVIPAVTGAVCQTAIVKERVDPILGFVEVDRYEFNDDLKHVMISELVHRNLFTVHAFLFEVAVWRMLGGYRDELLSLQDWEFNIRYCLHSEIAVLPRSLANWHIRIEPGSQSINGGGVGADHGAFRAYIRNMYIREAISGRVPPLVAAMMQESKYHGDTRDFIYRALSGFGILRRLYRLLFLR